VDRLQQIPNSLAHATAFYPEMKIKGLEILSFSQSG